MNLYKTFDVIGIAVFAFITIDAAVSLRSERSWRIWVRLCIGIAGLLVDGYLVFFY
jgi:uncharacterized membrane protein